MTIKNGTISGRIVAEPEDKKISDKLSILSFPLYSDHRVKNRDTGEWENDPTGTTKLQVELKFDIRDQWLGKLAKGDVVDLTGSFFEREYDKKDGTKGRILQTDFVESVTVKFAAKDKADGGFVPAGATGGF
jgi:single-stranded DNA-binding protein